MGQREKLIELLDEYVSSRKCETTTETLSDYLLANGVVVLPCRCENCEHFIKAFNDAEEWEWCTLRKADTMEDAFCSYAKRKGGDE